MEAGKETEQEGNLTVMKLPYLLPIKPNTHSHSLSSPIHSSMAASVPFSWEEEPGKPKQNSSSSSSSSPLASSSSSSPETHKSLDLPPRLLSIEKDGGSITKLQSPITVFDGPYSITSSRRLDSPSFRMMIVKSSGDCYGSFKSDINGDLDDVEEDRGSLALVKKRGRLGFFGFRKRKALKGKTEFGRGSYVFPSSVDRESEYNRKNEEGEGEDKSFGYGYGYGDCDGDGINCSQSSRFSEVKITNISRTGSFSALPATPSSSKSHFWTNVYAGLKQVVPWKNKKTTS